MSQVSLQQLEAVEDVESIPLGGLYRYAEAVYNSLSAITSSKSDVLKERSLKLLTRCKTAVEVAGVFSSNEEKDDIATADLKFLLAPFYLAEYLSNSAAPSPSDRLPLVQHAVFEYSFYLTRCQHYGLLGELCTRLLECYEAGRLKDPGMKRSAKIDKFKRDKDINGQLKRLEQLRAAMYDAEQDDRETAPIGGPDGLDDEQERQLWFLKLEQAALQALEQRSLLQEEEGLVKHSMERESRGTTSQRNEQHEQEVIQQRAEVLDKLRQISTQLDGSRREQLREQVFQPFHILPTMTVEQAGMLEMQDAMRRQAAADEASRANAEHKANTRSDEEDEDELKHQRAWDDFKDEHPFGSGNSKLRPCG